MALAFPKLEPARPDCRALLHSSPACARSRAPRCGVFIKTTCGTGEFLGNSGACQQRLIGVGQSLNQRVREDLVEPQLAIAGSTFHQRGIDP